MIGILDVWTLVFVLTIGHGISSILLFFSTRERDQLYDTVFMVSMALQAAGWLLFLFRGTIPDILSLSLGNTLIFSGFCLEGLALLSLVRPVDRSWIRFHAMVLVAALAILWLPLPGQGLTVGLVSFIVPFFFIFPGLYLAFSSPRPSSLQRFLGAVILMYIAAVLVRGVYILVSGNYSLLVPTFAQFLFLLLQIAMLAFASTGYILICREFALIDLEQDIARRQKIEEDFLAQSDVLEDRVRELRCLYTVSRLLETNPDPAALMPAVARVLPSGWRHPDRTGARIRIGDREYRSENFREGPGVQAQQAAILVSGKKAGMLEVVFTGNEKAGAETVFSQEDAELLAAIAVRLGRMLERQASEAALRESEEKYRNLFEQSNDAIFIADETTGQLIDCNRKAEELTGYTRDALLALNAGDLHPADTRERAMEMFRAFARGLETSIEMEILTRDGRRVPVSVNAAPAEVRGVRSLVGIFRDITWQKDVQKQILEKTEEVDQYFRTALDLFCIADTEGRFLRLNPEWEKALGWPVAELEGKKFLDFVHPDDIPATLAAIADLVQEKTVTGFINRYRHHDGSWRWIEWRSLQRGGRIIAAARDITRHHLDEHYAAGLGSLKQELLIASPLPEKLRKITDACVSLFSADFARIWITGPGDLCDRGCIHAGVTTGADACRDHAACLHLVVSSGRYTRTDGGHRRVPLGAYKIGRIALGEHDRLITNTVESDPRIHDHAWAADLGLVSFAGFRLTSREGTPVGVLAFFSGQPLSRETEPFLDDLATTTSLIIQAATAEEALRESEERYRNVITNAPMGMHFYRLDPGRGLVFTGANPDADRILKVNHDQFIGKTIGEAFPGLAGTEIPGRYRDVAETGNVWQSEQVTYHEGSISGAYAVTVFRTGPGSIAAMFEEITRRKQTEQALRESEEKFRAIIENIQDMVYRADLNGVFTMVSPSGARLLGFASPEEIIGMPVKDVYANPADRQVFLDVLSRKGSVYGYPLVLRARDGMLHHVVASSHFFRDAAGNVQGVEGILHNVTELRRAEEALRIANRKLNLLSSITRHDIKNQLMALNGYIELAVREIENPQKLRGYLSREEKIADTISRQISFTKDYEDLGVQAPAWQDVTRVVQEVSAALPLQAIRLEISCPGLEVYADPLLGKVFYNLIDNSLRYGGETMTTIRLSAEQRGADLFLVYTDDGEGISASDKTMLFTKGFGKHTGLGLFLSREILAITGMTIAENGEPGSGVRFAIVVPGGGYRFGPP